MCGRSNQEIDGSYLHSTTRIDKRKYRTDHRNCHFGMGNVVERLFSEASPACSVKKNVKKLISSAEEKKRKEYWSMFGEEGAEGRTKRKKKTNPL